MSTFYCSKCSYKSQTKSNTKSHIKNNCEGASVIAEIVKLSCNICYKEYETKYSLDNHKKNYCLKKKTTVVEKVGDKDEIIKMISNLSTVVNCLAADINEIKTSVKSLDARLNILESNNKPQVASNNKYEILNQDEDNLCDHKVEKSFVPTNYQLIKDIYKKYNITDALLVDVNIKGQRDNKYKGHIVDKGIEVEDIMYYYPDCKPRGCKSTEDLKVFYPIFCNNNATVRDKNGNCYCDVHKII